MKILILPTANASVSVSTQLLTGNLVSLFTSEGIQTAVCSAGKNSFRKAVFYSAPRPASSGISLVQLPDDSVFELSEYNAGCTSASYLKADMKAINDALDSFHPDLVINIGRTAALIVCRTLQIPCWSLMHASMQHRGVRFPLRCMEEINQILNDEDLDQELNLYSLYEKSDRCFCFAPESVQPLEEDANITHLGCMGFYPTHAARGKDVCIYLAVTSIPQKELLKIIRDAFLNAPYRVSVWYPGCRARKEQNLQFLEQPRFNLLSQSCICISDGSDYIFSQAMAAGIPQLILTQSHYLRTYNGMAAMRNGFGLLLPEDDVNMASLYESYRKVINDDRYTQQAGKIRREIIRLGDLYLLRTLILNVFKPEQI